MRRWESRRDERERGWTRSDAASEDTPMPEVTFKFKIIVNVKYRYHTQNYAF